MRTTEQRALARSPRVGSVLRVLPALLFVAACAGPAAEVREIPLSAVTARHLDEAAPDRVAPPDGPQEAREMLEMALGSLDDGSPRKAAALLEAILRSDQLTDRGRANVYWLTAESHRRAGSEERELAALSGFLVASDVSAPDDELLRRQVQARAALIAHKLRRDPALGSTPETSILVEDAREPASLIAILACGPNGRGRYVDVAIEAVGHEDARRLVHRRAACESDGRTLDLWFDVTLAEAGKPSADL